MRLANGAMATMTFPGRADAEKILLADAWHDEEVLWAILQRCLVGGLSRVHSKKKRRWP